MSLVATPSTTDIFVEILTEEKEADKDKTDEQVASGVPISVNNTPPPDEPVTVQEEAEVDQVKCLVCNEVLQPNGTETRNRSEEEEEGRQVQSEISSWGNSKMTMVEFCTVLRITVPPLKSSLRTNSTPLCHHCDQNVGKLRDLVKQLEDLERDILETRKLILESVTRIGEDSETLQETQDAESGVNSVGEIKWAVSTIRKYIRFGKYSAYISQKKRGRKTGKKKSVSPTTKEDASTEIISRKSSFGRPVKRPRHYMMSDDETSDNEIEKKFDPKITNDTQRFRSNDTKALSLSLVKVELANAGEKSTERTFGDVTPEVVGLDESKTEPQQLNEAEQEPQKTNLSDDNWSDGVEHIPEDEDVDEGVWKKKKYTKKLKKSNSKRRISSDFLGSRKIRKWTKTSGNFKKIRALGQTFRQSVIKERSSALNSQEVDNSKDGSHGKVMCDKCPRTFSDEKKKNLHVLRAHEGGKGYECKSCNKSFAKLFEFNNHQKVVHTTKNFKLDSSGRRLFPCDNCEVQFKNHADLLIHRRTHTGERPFKCSIDDCTEAFISKDRYEVHVEVKHPGNAPLKCEFCPRSFFRHHRLRDHKRSHTGEKSYLCEICSKAFSQPAYLKYHQTKHKELNLEEFKCDQCDKSFASPVNLKFHKETQHQKKYRYHCETCGHGASHMSHMKLHMRRHTGEKPHTCSLCQKSFTRGSQLKIHMRGHTGERPYPCKLCPKSFTNSSKLRRHELTHTGSKAKRQTSVQVKVAPLPSPVDQPQSNTHPFVAHSSAMLSPTLSTATISAAPAGFLLPADLVDVQVEEDANGQAVLKLEHVPAALADHQDGPRQLITIHQPNGVTYQIIAPEDGITSDAFADYLIINGDFGV